MVAEPLGTEPTSSFAARVDALRDCHAALWEVTPARLPVLGGRVGFGRRFANARAAARLIDGIAAEGERAPQTQEERRVWRETVRERLQEFGAARLGWPAGYRRLLFADAFYTASVDFVRRARRMAPELPLEAVGQALRNVWIGNSLQMLLDLPVALNRGLFAYSMLYPLTDNLLDDPRVAWAAKREFNRRFGRRLAGLPVEPTDAGEAAIFRLVGEIEAEYPRREFADVYASLLAIHAAQVESLLQQDAPELTDADLVAISCAKGGTSVLADLYLVAPRAAPAQQRFAFGYGVFLQLLDDLQDVEHDLAAGHQTVFTRAAGRDGLAPPTARLACYIDRVLDDEPLLAASRYADRKDLIRRNCRMLLVGAVAEQPRRFARRFRRALVRRWPFGFRAMRRLRRRAERRYRGVASRLAPDAGPTALLDRLLAESD